MTTSKKLILIIMLMVFTISFSSCGFSPNDYAISPAKPNDVATISLVSQDGAGDTTYGIFSLGHTFLAITNTSSNDIKVGKKVVTPNETITFSVWSISSHSGIWFNLESNYIKHERKYLDRISITTSINKDDLTKISTYMDEHDKWDPIYNCSKFSLAIWNLIAEEKEKIDTPFLYFPTYICDQISQFKESELNQNFITEDQAGYFFKYEYRSFKFEGGK